MLIDTLIALKMAELDDLAAQLTCSPGSVRALAQLRPDRWVQHLAELALLSELASRLEDDYRALVRSAAPAQRLASKSCTKTF